MPTIAPLALGGVHLVGVDMNTATKIGYTAIFVGGIVLLRVVARLVVRSLLRGRGNTRARFWSRQGINLATVVVLLLGFVSIWFDNGLHAAAALGVLTAAVAFAMQRVVTSIAGYFLILRGDIFSIGDRIVMGGVRGDVISLGFLRTTILEMGQPEGDDDASVPMWVQARQYTGRVVTVTNAAVFDEPVYNYSRDFPFIWEELHLPVKHDVDLDLVERLLREAVDKHAMHSAEIPDLLHQLRRRYFVPAREVSVEPEVFYTLTSNWIECAIRFVVPTHDIRRIKSNITRDLVSALAAHDVPVASTTYAVVDAPPITLASAHRPAPAYPNEPDAAPPRRTRAANGRAAKRPRS